MSATLPTADRGDITTRRTSSFGTLIKRTKSSDLLGERKHSGNRLRKKSLDSERRPSFKDTPPALPTLEPQPVIESFGGEDYSPSVHMSTSSAYTSRNAPPVPPLPDGAVETHAGLESMTHRSRYSYAHSSSSFNSPRRIRRRKDPTPYNVLVIGAKKSGKTSFIDFLKSSLALPPRKQPSRTSEGDPHPEPSRSSHGFIHHYQEIEIENERVGLTLWDSQGLEKGIVDLQLRELTGFVESKFEETFAEEMKVIRSPGVRDTEIHCVFLMLDPASLDMNINAVQEVPSTTANRMSKPPRITGALDEDFDLQVLRSFQGKTTMVPIISKADTITTAHMAHLKQMVWHSLKQAGIDPLEALNTAENDDNNRLHEADEDIRQMHNGAVGEDISAPGSPQTNGSDGPVDSVSGPGSPERNSHIRNTSRMSISSLAMDGGYVPMSILSPDRYSLDPRNGPVGRRFPWGFADPYDPDHCDFVKLRDLVFNEWRSEVREASRDIFYERWRTNRLNRQAAAKVASNTAQPRKSSGGIPIHLKSSKSHH